MIDVKKLREDLMNKNHTLYCSVMAHLRGKLHMVKLNGGTLYDVIGKDCWSYFGYGNKECIADARRHIFHWTMEDQAEYVKDTIEAYTIEEREKLYDENCEQRLQIT
jgi:hypothetical protein